MFSLSIENADNIIKKKLFKSHTEYNTLAAVEKRTKKKLQL